MEWWETLTLHSDGHKQLSRAAQFQQLSKKAANSRRSNQEWLLQHMGVGSSPQVLPPTLGLSSFPTARG